MIQSIILREHGTTLANWWQRAVDDSSGRETSTNRSFHRLQDPQPNYFFPTAG